MNGFDIGDILFVSGIISAIGAVISELFICVYLYKKKLMPGWKLTLGLYFPWKGLGQYLKTTREEYGHAGIWLKLFFLFSELFFISCFVGVAIEIAQCAAWPVILVVIFSALILLPLLSYAFYKMITDY